MTDRAFYGLLAGVWCLALIALIVASWAVASALAVNL